MADHDRNVTRFGDDPTPAAMAREWRCFHCDEVFTDKDAAADHFGVQIDGCADDVACKLNATEGLLVKMLREAHEKLRRYHQEDNAAFREFYALGADHATALRREEEKGYARGLKDYNKVEQERDASDAVVAKRCAWTTYDSMDERAAVHAAIERHRSRQKGERT